MGMSQESTVYQRHIEGWTYFMSRVGGFANCIYTSLRIFVMFSCVVRVNSKLIDIILRKVNFDDDDH